MNKKEAWKSLSHIFHHKTSGRKKTELRLRRIEEERKTLQNVTSDTSGMQAAFTRRQEQTGEAHMVLSVGNRSYVPLGEEAIGSGGKKKKNKGGAGDDGPSGSGSSSKRKGDGPRVLG